MNTGEGDEPVVARVTPEAGNTVAELLGMPLGLDVWERSADHLVVAAPESRLRELERRRLARVDRWATAAQYVAQMRARPPTEDDEPEPPGGGG
ncbi:hypothetical protein [Geodermatophilus sp. SYSU D01105]